MTDKREELIDVLVEKPQHKISSNSQGGYDCRCGARWDWQKPEKEAAERHAAGYLADRLFAVFEQAHTPTDDEREALAEIVTYQTFMDATPNQEADAILAAGFRRTVQGEPTDAQVRAAYVAWSNHPRDINVSALEYMRSALRAALRAAAATQERENRG